MRRLSLLYISLSFALLPKLMFAQIADGSETDPIKISQDFLYAARTGDSTYSYQNELKQLNEENLSTVLDTDAKKIAFWLNIYNGFTQVILSKNPDKYKNRGAFYSDKQIEVAGNLLSLDLIEHGILRHSKVKWAEGYLSKWFPSKFEKNFRVEKLDYRIHFALNCGAKSCPPIAFYEPKELNDQLNVAVKTYLKGECEYDSLNNTVKVPALMGWFRGDFGGKNGIRKILLANKIIPQGTKPNIKFKTYDWTLYLNNFKS